MPGKKINEPCCICGKTKEDGVRLGRYLGLVYCGKHLHQMQRHGEILPENKTRNRLTTCCICGEKAVSTWSDGKEYCQKHYMQLYNNGRILENTIFEPNKYEDHEDYTECITLNKDFEESGRVLIDLDKKELVKSFKVYICKHGSKLYAVISIHGKKCFLHRFLMGVHEEKYNTDIVVDHINGNSLDNRLSNLRLCSQRDNSKNNKGNSKITGVSLLKSGKYTARIMHNYQHFHIGNYDTYEEAVLARIIKERELFNEFGPNKDLYYIIDHPSPIEELKKVLSEGV